MAMKSEIQAALHAHAAWRERFKDILHGRAAFDIAMISASDQCNLGKWLMDEGYRMIPSELHDEICVVHQEFHRIAADILQKIREKRYAEAKEDIALEGAFNQTSKKLKSLLVKLSFKEPLAAKPTVLANEASAGAQETLEPSAVSAVEGTVQPKEEE
jgi:methyl-accepting chemotaxis protein